MFKGHPKGLYALALANTGERFGYYTMLAIFVLFLQAKFGYNEAQAGNIYGIFLGPVMFNAWPIWICWTVFFAVCIISMGVMFGMVKWLERVTE